eukprot:PhF_6_TR42853/c0_g1_i1/m.64907
MKYSDIAKDSLRILAAGQYKCGSDVIKLSIRSGIQGTKAIPDPSLLNLTSTKGGRGGSGGRIVLCQGDTLDAAQYALKNIPGCKHVAVLNFASDTNPGGGYKSNQRGTQEESNCRRSSLPLCLESAPYPIGATGVIYSPQVVVFRSNEKSGYTLLPDPYHVGVISAALRQCDVTVPKQRIELLTKIDGVLRCAVHNQHDCVVLGAWGCGAFGNDPKDIALAHSEIVNSYVGQNGLETVIFAIPKGVNFDAFKEIFSSCDLHVL